MAQEVKKKEKEGMISSSSGGASRSAPRVSTRPAPHSTTPATVKVPVVSSSASSFIKKNGGWVALLD